MSWERTHPIEDEQRVLELARAQKSPGDIAAEARVNRPYVYYVLAKHGIDWLRGSHGKRMGRPRKPLLLGQQLLTERLHAANTAQYDIATAVNASLPRIQRHLVSRGLYQRPQRTTDHRDALMAAIADYLAGTMRVVDILDKHGITAPTFYAALHARGIDLRRNPGRPRRATLLEQSHETVRG